MASRKEDYYKRIEYLKQVLGGKCTSCGATTDLQFHHLNNKLFTVTQNWSASLDKVLAEISKCKLLCGTCHRNLHRVPHGTNSMYSYSRCRCSLCKSAHSKVMYEYSVAHRVQKHRQLRKDTHGTDVMYNHGKCRCDLCKAAHNTRIKEYRLKKRGIAQSGSSA